MKQLPSAIKACIPETGFILPNLSVSRVRARLARTRKIGAYARTRTRETWRVRAKTWRVRANLTRTRPLKFLARIRARIRARAYARTRVRVSPEGSGHFRDLLRTVSNIGF